MCWASLRYQVNFWKYLEASESKWVNPVLNIIWVKSLRLGGLHFTDKTVVLSKYKNIDRILEIKILNKLLQFFLLDDLKEYLLCCYKYSILDLGLFCISLHQSNHLFLNFPEEIVRDVFDRCGEITTIRLSKKNFCHIRYEMEEFVDNAIFLSGKVFIIEQAKQCLIK